MSEPKETYLGDGLYASFDGWQVALRAPREDGDHVVYLEPKTLRALLQYAPVEAAVARETRPAASEPVNAAPAGEPQPPEVDNAGVICPNCCHQFRAIPVDVQRLMLDAGFEPPFTHPPAASEREGEARDDESVRTGFREYDQQVTARHQTAWQVWRDAIQWADAQRLGREKGNGND